VKSVNEIIEELHPEMSYGKRIELGVLVMKIIILMMIDNKEVKNDSKYKTRYN